MTNKIPPGDYSVENGYLQKDAAGYILMSPDYSEAIATIGFSLPGVPQLEVRERSAEEFLKESFIKNVQSRWPGVEWEAANGKDGSGYQWVYEAMHAFRSQPIAPVSEEEIEKVFEDFSKQNEMDLEFVRHFFIPLKNKIIAALSRTQSGYTREQMESKDFALRQCLSYLNSFHGQWMQGEENLFEMITQSLYTPSITSVTIGEENNIIDIKYK